MDSLYQTDAFFMPGWVHIAGCKGEHNIANPAGSATILRRAPCILTDFETPAENLNNAFPLTAETREGEQRYRGLRKSKRKEFTSQKQVGLCAGELTYSRRRIYSHPAAGTGFLFEGRLRA